MIDLPPLNLLITEQDLTRNVLDAVPLASGQRRRRAADAQAVATLDDPFVQLGEPGTPTAVGKALPPLLVKFAREALTVCRPTCNLDRSRSWCGCGRSWAR